MIICDANMKILAVDPRCPGSCHDAFSWRYSRLRRKVEHGLLDDGEFLLGNNTLHCKFWSCKRQWISTRAVAAHTSVRASWCKHCRRAVQRRSTLPQCDVLWNAALVF
ncbi:uncharacterized protein LOC144106769 isoform X1 [Amblyomma americanum]